MPKRVNPYVTLNNILSGKWLIEPSVAKAYYPLVLSMLEGKKAFNDDEEDKEAAPARLLADPNVFFVSDWAEAAPPEDAPENSVAIIGLRGAITKYDQWCGGPGTLTKVDHFNRALANPNIKGIVWSIDSGGGEGAACEMLTAAIRNATKPVVVYINGMAASAAYWIASSANHIVLDGETSEVGSIGTYVSFADFTAYYEKMGVKIHEVYAPQSTLKNKAYRDTLNGDNAAMLEDLRVYTDFFINAVKGYRGDKLSDNKAIFQGAMFYKEQAIAEGLADSSGSLADAVAIVRDLAEKKSINVAPNQNSNMKYSLKAAWTSLLAFFAITPQAGAETIEHEVTSEQWEKLNAKVGEVDTLTARVAELENEVAQKSTALTEMTQSRDDFKAKFEAKPAVAPGAVAAGDPPAPGKKETEEEDIINPNASHNRMMAELTK